MINNIDVTVTTQKISGFTSDSFSNVHNLSSLSIIINTCLWIDANDLEQYIRSKSKYL